jgi:uncharacterized protein (TIGR00730 family)
MKQIGIFISSNHAENPVFNEITKQLAHELARRNIGIVYGGASVGLMGVLADTMLDLNGSVVGVIPSVLAKKEISHACLTQLHHVDTMQDRKKLLAELSDAFIIMPGGLGTLEEFFEIWNAAKIGLHHKPIGLLNVDGYFDDLLQFINQAIKKGFIYSSHLNLITVSDNPVTLLDKMKVGVSC